MSFSCDSDHTARKARPCDECGRAIEPGQRYNKWVGTTDGDFSTWFSHVECRAATIELNKLHGADWDEWMNLSDMEHEDRDWLRGNHPVVADRFGLSVYDWQEPRLYLGAHFSGGGSHYFWQVPA